MSTVNVSCSRSSVFTQNELYIPMLYLIFTPRFNNKQPWSVDFHQKWIVPLLLWEGPPSMMSQDILV